jgi:REP element-mobilizing transposase RayT
MHDHKAILTAGGYYHVFNRAVGSEKLFAVEDNFLYFFQRMTKYIMPVSDLFCYCLLPNHFHFFLRIKEENLLCEHMEYLKYRHGDDPHLIPVFLLQQFSNCFNSYTKSFNRVQNRKGKLFIEPFSRRSVNSPGYYTKLIHYIHANPVHHGLCKKIEGWPYSSYGLLQQPGTGWLQCEEVIRWFGSVPAFREFHAQRVERKFAINPRRS